MYKSLLYVSECLLTKAQAAEEINAIVSVSRSRNAALELTGALISTPSAFAQLLEGSEVAVTDMMESIRRDPRHTNVTVVSYDDIANRRFARWAMAYSGASPYIAQYIEPLLMDQAPGRLAAHSHALTRLMREFDRRF